MGKGRPRTLTDEQRRAYRAQWQKKYREKVFYYYRDYPNLEECYKFAVKCLRRSVVFNSVLLIAAVLGWIL